MANIKAVKGYKTFKIYINKILHLQINLKNHDGVQSWFEGENNRLYYIELYRVKGEPIVLEYDDFNNWKMILKLIDTNI